VADARQLHIIAQLLAAIEQLQVELTLVPLVG